VLRLDAHGYSPALFCQFMDLSGQLHSFKQAEIALKVLTGLVISSRHLNRLARAIGAELTQARDAKTVKRRRRELLPQVANVPSLAVVEVDGGRLLTRAPGQGPGVHQVQPKEDKIACLMTMKGASHEQDPQPEPPPAFLDLPRVARLTQRLHGHCATAAQVQAQPDDKAEVEAEETLLPTEEGQVEPWRGAPKRLVRTCVATMQESKAFGPMVAAEAQTRNLYAAPRGAFVGDGQQYNWKIQRTYFRDFEPINDFVHVVTYLYMVGWLVGGALGLGEPERRKQYERWLGMSWQGCVEGVIEEMAGWQERLGRPPPGEKLAETDPRRVLQETLTYLRNNKGRMEYPRYRREGLPVTSSLVESLVGEFNNRVKGKDKYWDRPEGAEAILQIRAAVLSQDDRLAKHFAARPGNPYRRKRRV
jgi:hypothetical protein